MKTSKIITFAASLLVVVSCGNNARISGTISDAPDSQVVVKQLNINAYNVLDTLKTDAQGAVSYKFNVEKGQPEFIYLFLGDTKVASFIVKSGDAITFKADSKGSYTVEGSDESEALRLSEAGFSEFMGEFADILGEYDGSNLKQVQSAASKRYVDYYREALRNVMSNPYSLSNVQTLFQKINGQTPVFGNATDAIIFQNICDSLKTVYPESRYVKALEKEASKKSSEMALMTMLDKAQEAGFPDLNIPDVNGTKVALSSIDAKVIMVLFWTASEAEQKMFNLDTLLPLYEKYHSRGFEVYQVAIDNDKQLWASAVKNQNLPWINVCDGLGTASSSLSLYNVTKLPSAYLIANGKLVDDEIDGDAQLKRFLDNKLAALK